MHLLKWSAAVTLGAGGSEQETAQGRRDLNLHFISGRPPKQCNLPSAWRERGARWRWDCYRPEAQRKQQFYTRFLPTKPGRTATSEMIDLSKSCESPWWFQMFFWTAVLDHILTSRGKCSEVSLSLLILLSITRVIKK